MYTGIFLSPRFEGPLHG